MFHTCTDALLQVFMYVVYLVKERIIGAFSGAGLLDGGPTDDLDNGIQLSSQQLPGLQNVHTDLQGQPHAAVYHGTYR